MICVLLSKMLIEELGYNRVHLTGLRQIQIEIEGVTRTLPNVKLSFHRRARHPRGSRKDVERCDPRQASLSGSRHEPAARAPATPSARFRWSQRAVYLVFHAG